MYVGLCGVFWVFIKSGIIWFIFVVYCRKFIEYKVEWMLLVWDEWEYIIVRSVNGRKWGFCFYFIWKLINVVFLILILYKFMNEVFFYIKCILECYNFLNKLIKLIVILLYIGYK